MASSLVSSATCTQALGRYYRRRTQTAVKAAPRPSASPSSTSNVDALKKQLLSAVAASRKPGTEPLAAKRRILDATTALEAVAAKGVLQGGDGVGNIGNANAITPLPFADVSGRWSLVYSTNDDGGILAAVLDDDTFQRISNQLYKLFFSFAPALAGSADTGAKGVANEQVVDLVSGRVENIVDVTMPWPFRGAARIGVMGEVEAVDAEAREVMVTFTEWEVGPAPGGGGGGGVELPRLRLPLPRPRGMLRNTFCDETLRLSRGGRGGVFITSRLPSSATSSPE